MRAHEGIGTSHAHLTVSTAPMTASVSFHEPVRWDGWLLYTHESTQVGAGMSYVRGAVHTEEGELIASFAHDALIRPLRTTDTGSKEQSRLWQVAPVRRSEVDHIECRIRASVECMLAAGSVKISDLLSVTPPSIAAGAHAMTQMVELPPADAGLAPHRHSGPVFGYVLEGRMLFELEGEEPREIVAGEAFWEPGGDVVHYQMVNLEENTWTRFLAVCICAPGVQMITMLDSDEITARDHLRHPSARRHQS
jgi:quercetin dioxygenase-like cupin family protein